MTSGLFKNKAIKTKLEGYEIPDFDLKLGKVKMWYEAYENKSLHKKSESQCEQAFNQSFFIEILGYKGFPNETYTIDPKGNVETGGQKPDAILGYFSEEKRRVIAVVEIKDVNTSLDKSQKREGSLSPVQQAFKYKPQYKECDFVIATNFFEIRLLKDNQLDFESFTLESLVNPKGDYFEFRKFYFLLNVENFMAKSGQTKTLKLLSDIRIEQEQITKKFYQQYQNLRNELIKNILKNNQQARVRESFYVLAVEKAQKIIDRLVFICFCEDLDLLPDDKLQEVVFHTEKLGLAIPIWDIMKSFFSAIDHGSDKLGIPDGYNGELFKEDDALNKLKIDDEICKKFVELGKYDFSEDLSVNILGHIFEQSISDLEELKSIAKKLDEDIEIPLKTSKRKKDGIYYTPDYIVDYIVKNSLGKYLEGQEEQVLEKYGVNVDLTDKNYYKRMKTAFEEYRNILLNVKILDPACGSGAFLVKVYDYLLLEHQRITSVIATLSEGKIGLDHSLDNIKSLLQNNIYGVDLNPESVEITKLSLWLKTAQKGEKLVSLKNNIKCGNSLINDPTIAGEHSFNWKEEFPEIMKQGGFDVIIGNPPYVFARGGNFDEKTKRFYYDNFPLASFQLNTYLLFIDQAFYLLKKDGYFGFIIPNTWLTIDTFSQLRKFLLEETSDLQIINIFDKVFVEANVDTCLLIFKKGNPNYVTLGEFRDQQLEMIGNFSVSQFEENTHIIKMSLFKNHEASKIMEKIQNSSQRLRDFAIVSTGIKVYQVGKGKPKQTEEIKKTRSFHSNQKKGESHIKYLEGKDVGRYNLNWSGEYLNYGEWIAEPRRSINFADERILVRQIPSKPPYCINAIFTDEYYLNDINSMVIYNFKVNPLFILGIINSKLISFWFINQFDKLQRGLFPQFKVKELAIFPIVNVNEEKQIIIIEEVKKMLSLHKNFQENLQKVLRLLQREFQLEKINTKLEKFYELDFDSFIKVIGIKKIDLQKKSELIDFFEKNKQKLLDFKTEIEKENETIDNIVFDLFGVTSEEREVILKS